MRSVWLIAFACLLWAQPAQATVALGGFSNPTEGTGELSWTTPAVTPAGVFCIAIQTGTLVDEVTAIDWGGTEITQHVSSPVTVDAASAFDDAVISFFFRGSSIPSGAQTATMTVSGSTLKQVGCWALTGSANLEIVDLDFSICAPAQTDPQVTLALGGRTSYALFGLHSGWGTNGSTVVLTNWTIAIQTVWGSNTASAKWVSYDLVDTTDVLAGVTASSDDACLVAAAVSEVVAGAVTPRGTLLGVLP